MHLIPVVAGRGRSVVAHGDRKEMEHQVRIRRVVVGTSETAALEVVGGPRSSPEQPLQADERPSPQLEVSLHRYRLGACVLHVDLEVVLQVLADAGQVMDHRHPGGLEDLRRADPRDLKQLWGVERAATQDDFRPAGGLLRATTMAILDAYGAGSVEDDTLHRGPGDDREVLAAEHRVQVGPGGGEPPASTHIAIERGKPLLAIAVDIRRRREPRLAGGLEEGRKQRVGGRTALQLQGPGAAVPFVVRRQTVFHPLEIRKTVRI